MNVQLAENLVVTTTHPLSHGKPVLLVIHGLRLADGWLNAFSPTDFIEVHSRSAPAAYWAQHYGKNLTGEGRQLVAEYLRQWLEGPQLAP